MSCLLTAKVQLHPIGFGSMLAKVSESPIEELPGIVAASSTTWVALDANVDVRLGSLADATEIRLICPLRCQMRTHLAIE